jgi:hypothetical protein
MPDPITMQIHESTTSRISSLVDSDPKLVSYLFTGLDIYRVPGCCTTVKLFVVLGRPLTEDMNGTLQASEHARSGYAEQNSKDK